MPAALCSRYGWQKNPLRPVFFAPTDIQPGGLTEELQQRLRDSRHLVVICSPHSAQSEWVGREIEYFHQLGRTAQIHFFIVDGIPHSGDPLTECFNPVVDRLGLPEILGANVNEKIYRSARLNRERAYVQLVSKLLGVEFDAVWQRHKRLLRRRNTAWAAGTLLVLAALAAVWMLNRAVNVSVECREASPHNANLPDARDIVVTLTLDNETKSDTLATWDDKGLFANIPRHFMGKPARITAQCPQFVPLDTVMTLRPKMALGLQREVEYYGRVHFKLWSIREERTYPGVRLEIDGIEAFSDAEGCVDLLIPVERQRPLYGVSSPLLHFSDSLLRMPCSEDAVLIVGD